MTRIYHLLIGLFLSVILFLSPGCKEDLRIDDSDKNYPLDLRSRQDNDLVHLEWDAPPVTRFEAFVLVRSTLPIPDGRNPFSSSVNTQVVMQTDQPDSTRFTDLALPLADELYYKLYVDIGDRFVESPSVRTNYFNLLVEGSAFSIRFFPDSNWVLVANDQKTRLQLIDYNQGKIISSSSDVTFSNFSYLAAHIGRYNGQPELYWWPGNVSFYTYELPSLVLKHSANVGDQGFGVTANNDGLLFLACNDYTNSFSTRRRSDFSLLKGVYESNYYDRRLLEMIDESTNRILEVSTYNMTIFNVNGATGAIGNQEYKNLNGYGLPETIPVSQDRKYFIPQMDGKVYDQDFNLIAQLPNVFNNGAVDFSFAPDNEHIYALFHDFNQTNVSRIDKYSYPSMELVGTRSFANATPRRIHATPDGVVFVGTAVNNLSKYIVKKITL